ncbi:hypothetical protein Hdeb2414_s0013g00417681 [Helianthus debilis subsp. tardiflorus]
MDLLSGSAGVVVRILIMDLLSGSAGVVMDRDSGILITMVSNICFETVDLQFTLYFR